MKLLLTLLMLIPLLHAEETPAKKNFNTWAKSVEKLHPITDAQGHGPDIGSGEWISALDKKLGITDKEGHGPDLGSEEWRKAVDRKLATEKRELLSSHSTVAKFIGIKDHVCRGATGLCPDRCGSSGKLATFEIIEYLAYEKPGEYGDPKQTTFQILIKDNQGNAKISAEILAAIESLKPETKVKLSWNHDYVTKDKSSSPERPITKIEAL